MFCQKCGKYNLDNKEKCVYCGGKLGEEQIVKPKQSPKSTGGRNTAVVGAVLAFFLGIIGLIIGFLIYPEGDKRNEFVSGWTKCFITCLIIGAILGLLVWSISYSAWA